MENEKKRKIGSLVNTAYVYALLAMAGGVFYREFTKFHDFSGRTALAVVHTHLFLLGMMFFLVLALFEFHVPVTADKGFGRMLWIYNAGVAVMVVMLMVRGITQVLGMELSRAMDASISGIAGIGHILVAVGITVYFGMLKKAVAG